MKLVKQSEATYREGGGGSGAGGRGEAATGGGGDGRWWRCV